MNIYICSTVRNLLLAVLKAIGEADQASCILMIQDQQDVDVDNFDLKALPDHIKFVSFKRSDLRGQMHNNITTRLLRVLATFNIRTCKWMRSYVRARLFNDLLKDLRIDHSQLKNLFLFNDRNKVARIFRLGFSEYSIIEDGLANYYGNKLKPMEKIWRFLSGHPVRKRYLGDDPRCRRIYLLNPEKAPAEIATKVWVVDFIDHRIITNVCYQFFGYQDQKGSVDTARCILVSQPVSIGGLESSGFDLEIYRQVIAYLESRHVSVVVKVHPREKIEKYREAFPGYVLKDSKQPLEMMILGADEPVNIVSIYSTAGMGFEKFCKRITLVEDSESESMGAVFSVWQADPEALRTRIVNRLSQMGIA